MFERIMFLWYCRELFLNELELKKKKKDWLVKIE